MAEKWKWEKMKKIREWENERRGRGMKRMEWYKKLEIVRSVVSKLLNVIFDVVYMKEEMCGCVDNKYVSV